MKASAFLAVAVLLNATIVRAAEEKKSPYDRLGGAVLQKQSASAARP